MVPTVKTIRKKNPMPKFKATKLPPRGVVSLPLRPMAGAGTSRVTSRRVKMTFYDLEHSVHEDIIAVTDDLGEISAKVTALLNGLHPEDNFVVRRVAKDISEAIANELAVKDGDMVTVIRTLSAVLDPMIAWLEHHGHNGRSLRQVAPNKTQIQIRRQLQIQHQLRNASRSNAPPDNEKAPGGKFSYGEVRGIVREVITNPSLGKQIAFDILDEQGRGARSVSSMKPENLDTVYEACRNLLAGKIASAEAERDPLVEQSVGGVVQLREWCLGAKRGDTSNRDKP
jgi:hypothetical protein